MLIRSPPRRNRPPRSPRRRQRPPGRPPPRPPCAPAPRPRAWRAPPPRAAVAPPPRPDALPPPRAMTCAASCTASPMVCTTSLHERIESSLPGIGKSIGTGSTFESTSPMIGIRRRSASRTAIASVFRSMISAACGSRFIPRTPPRLYSSFSSSDSRAIRSLVGNSASCPSSRSGGQLVQAIDPRGHRVEVGQQAAQPPLVHVWHAAAIRPLLDRVAGLLLGAHEQDRPALAGHVGGEPRRLGEQVLGLQQVDDVDPVALPEDVRAHAGIPAARLVAEMQAGLQQLLDSRLGHRAPLSRLTCSPDGAEGTQLLELGRAPALRRGSVTGRGRILGPVSPGDHVAGLAGLARPLQGPTEVRRQPGLELELLAGQRVAEPEPRAVQELAGEAVAPRTARSAGRPPPGARSPRSGHAPGACGPSPGAPRPARPREAARAP